MRTVKSGVQAPKDGGARAGVLLMVFGDWKLETGCVNADYSHTRAGALPRGLVSQAKPALSALDRARVGCCDRGQLAGSWPADQWRWSRGCNELEGSSGAQWACLHSHIPSLSPWFTSCTVGKVTSHADKGDKIDRLSTLQNHSTHFSQGQFLRNGGKLWA